VRAVWDNFEALAAHFHASSDPTSTQFEKELRSKFGGLHTKLCSPQFVEDLGLMYDCLEELKSLSESLQRRNMNIPEADKLIRRSIRRFEIFKETPGQKMAEALTLRDSLLFGTTPLKSNSKHVAIHNNQFLQGLADNLRRRLMSVASNGGVTQVASGSTERQEQLSKQVITQLAVLNPHNWPNEIELNFGQDEVRLLCSRFRIQYSKVKDAFDDFKDDGGRRSPDNLKPLINSVNTIPVSTADCERGFSAMNVILSDLRSSLLLQHVSALLFVKLHGPPLQLWQPDCYVESWLTKHRLATDTRSRVAVATYADAVKNPDPLWTIL
jgi:hAT family C-terminal dimerisation region